MQIWRLEPELKNKFENEITITFHWENAQNGSNKRPDVICIKWDLAMLLGKTPWDKAIGRGREP